MNRKKKTESKTNDVKIQTEIRERQSHIGILSYLDISKIVNPTKIKK